MTYKKIRWMLYSLLLFLKANAIFAQCAMCRATVETNAHHGDIATAVGLNKGILYLFFTPYILAGLLIFVFCWYRSKGKVEINVEVLHD